MNWEGIRGKPARFVIGLCAGVSCMGIEGAVARIRGETPRMHVKLVESGLFPFHRGLRNRLLAVRKTPQELGLLHFELGEQLSAAGSALMEAARKHGSETDFISCQGLCVAHTPPRSDGRLYGGLELGEPGVIAARTGLPVVSGFTARDMAEGGQGRPFAPFGDQVLFARKEDTVAVLHLGGFARLTVVPPEPDKTVSFDVGPCNLALDGAVNLATGGARDCDTDGELAARGVVMDDFLDYLLERAHFSRMPPKSAPLEEFSLDVYLRDALTGQHKEQSVEDVMATVATAVTFSIARAYTRFVRPYYEVSRIIITGGGSRNETLMRMIAKSLHGVVIKRSDDYGLPAIAADPIRAAIMGHEAFMGRVNSIPGATGSHRAAVMGSITQA